MFDLGEAYPEAYPLEMLLLKHTPKHTPEAYLRSIPHSQTSRPGNLKKIQTHITSLLLKVSLNPRRNVLYLGRA